MINNLGDYLIFDDTELEIRESNNNRIISRTKCICRGLVISVGSWDL